MQQLDQATQQAADNAHSIGVALNGFNLAREVHQISNSNGSVGKRLFRIHEVLDGFNKVVTPFTACRNKCSYCCHQSVMVSLPEARAISYVIGRRYVRPSTFITDNEGITAAQKEYRGVPCPFLQEGKCSIYAYRPMMCRTQFNVSDTNYICDTVNHPDMAVPMLSLGQVYSVAIPVLGVHYQDIRVLFPTTTGI